MRIRKILTSVAKAAYGKRSLLCSAGLLLSCGVSGWAAPGKSKPRASDDGLIAARTEANANPESLKLKEELLHQLSLRVLATTEKMDKALAEEALLTAAKILELDPDNLKARYFLGNMAFYLKAFDRAITIFKKLHDLAPDHRQIHIRYIQSLVAAKSYETGLSEIAPFLEKNPKDFDVLWLKAVCLMMTGKGKEADAILAATLETAPTERDRKTLLALMRAAKKQYESERR